MYLILIVIPFGYLFGLPKNYFRKVEFSCKFQLPRAKIITLNNTGRVVSGPYRWTTYCVGVSPSKGGEGETVKSDSDRTVRMKPSD